ncbi:peptide ABC transporter substrate-binding protein [Mycobacterium intracellulare]|uniref:Bacterial extracellular solute-binding s, 5 Middle family protein n=2 Tax=Mycobacterium intracellulare TaxID=1767 RepID=X8CMH2_MYCIT|nr:ABC transporter substrate-binding protein [Mycobacterium intracellulare]EUA57036.1 bacterial extracellular solute-binding s, 5 Middle family protein [Mycobacterium intracellulare 1956]EUA25049.1 bacterial extracellular solute-binding s, 5 Middle family protein [Mycobacterium intracellulare]MCA2231956.1 ABC transporter substrate-binding protein [Mycobacterium intracellulare]MCA2250460.1 ABC transporter substrate-binding protein [Mycobacterium intracellulare]MCA2253882.1 ABC transporter subst
MRTPPALLAPVVAAMLVVASLAGCGGGVLSPDLVVVNGGEPPNPLIPTGTNDSQGGRILDRLFAGLMSYDATGHPSPEVAQSIDTTDNVNYRVVLKPGWTFTDGSPVTAHSFVDAWNYGALSTNGQLQQSFFSPIDGFDAVAGLTGDGTPTATTMSGLRVINDLEFTVRLKAPTIDFRMRLGHSAFYPLPRAAFRDMSAFGQHPIGNGPYQLAEGPDGPAWEHNVRIDLRPNPGYRGNRRPHNKGLRFEFYANLDTAYADLLSGNLDVLDTIPPSALPVYKRDLGDKVTSGPAAINLSLDTPFRLPHFGGEEGRLRRLALSAAINRAQISRQIFVDTRSPARDFTARSLPGFDPNIAGNDALDFNPGRARQLWAQADAISAWSGRYAIAYNADAGHQDWVDAVANSIKNVLGIDAAGAPQPTFAGFRTQITNRSIATAFRAGWQGDYPSMIEFLAPLFATGAGSNDVGYSSREFDAALATAEAAADIAQATRLANDAQRILFHDMPVVPLWNYISVLGWSAEVSNVTVTWNGLPDYENIVKA